MSEPTLNAYLVYSDDLPPDGIFRDDFEPREIIFAKTRSQARGIFCKSYFLPFTAKLHIRIVDHDVHRHEGHSALDDDPIWQKVDPAFAEHIKRDFERGMIGGEYDD